MTCSVRTLLQGNIRSSPTGALKGNVVNFVFNWSQIAVFICFLSSFWLGPGGSAQEAPAANAPAAPPVIPAEALQTAIISVEGMVCDACAQSINEALLKIEGVQSCEASFARKNATVVYAKGQVQPTKLAAAIQELGYQASLEPGPKADQPKTQTSSPADSPKKAKPKKAKAE